MTFLSGLALHTALSIGLVTFLYGAGWLSLRLPFFAGFPHRSPVLCFGVGMSVVVGVFSSFSLGRPTYLLLVPAALVVPAILRRGGRENPVPPMVGPVKGLLASALGACVGSGVFCRVWYSGLPAHGMIALPFKDWGYFAILVENLARSGHMSIWSGIADGQLASIGRDMWYHWGFLWLGALVKQISGLGALVSLTEVAVPATMAMAWISSACVVSRMTGWSASKSFLPALFCLFFVALGPSMWLQPAFIGTFGIVGVIFCSEPFVTIPWLPFESIYFFSVLWAWLSGRREWCWAFLLAASVSAPHSFLALGSTLGVFGALGILRREWADLKTAAAGLSAVLVACIGVKWVFGGGLSNPGSASAISLALLPLWQVIRHCALDLAATIVLLGLAFPGFLHLLIGKKSTGDQSATALGWIVLSAILAGVAGFRLLEFIGFGSIDAVILPGLIRVLIILPICAFGTLRLLAKGQPAAVRLAAVVLGIVGILQIFDLPAKNQKNLSELPPISRADAATLSAHLNGDRFGYFASSDRNWWIPVHASLAAVLGTSCVRLNPIGSVDNDWAGKQYGSDLPFRIVPRADGEPDEKWACRFAEKLGIRHLLQTDSDPLPENLAGRFAPIARAGGYVLYESRPAAHPTSTLQ